jgi:predicted lipid carrier protein YhbT
MTKNEMQALSEMVRARAPSSMAQPAQLAPQTSSQQVIAALLSNALRRPGIGGVLPAYANEQK